MIHLSDKFQPDHKNIAVHIRLFPSTYGMGAHDTNVCNFSANELERLQALHLERTKLTTKVIDERDGVKNMYNTLLKKYEAQSDKISHLRGKLAELGFKDWQIDKDSA